MNKTSLLILAAGLTQAASANVVFQADFNGTGSGTGGASDIATLGGTGSIYDTASDDDIVSSISDGKLTVTDGAAKVGRKVGVTLNPTSIDNGFNSWFEDTSDSLGYDSVNGALDFFFQSTETELTGTSIRPIDVRLGQNDQLRLILTTNTPSSGTGPFAVQILDYSSGSGVNIGGASYNFSDYQANTLYHVAVTLETGVDGLITTNIYITEGNTTISSAAIADGSETTSASFNSTGTTLNNSFTFGTHDIDVARVVEFDSFRLYDSIPTEFSAIPEPQTFALSFGSIALLAAIGLKRKGGHHTD
ncbi:hypothetical protein [Coraliomargarita parva]|uniref:hypothetical protein n=1 Tax=Coraliomargarita parva TaxID=3014050 RepID=UPI0022B59B8B|nr:hypothetical protein [Coraliomargarita parva]